MLNPKNHFKCDSELLPAKISNTKEWLTVFHFNYPVLARGHIMLLLHSTHGINAQRDTVEAAQYTL